MNDAALAGWQDALVATLKATPGALQEVGATPEWRRIGGSALTSVWSLDVGPARFFVKTADGRDADMLAAEAEALRALAESGSVRVPQVYAIDGAWPRPWEWAARRSSFASRSVPRRRRGHARPWRAGPGPG